MKGNVRLAVLLLRMDGAPDLPSRNYAENLFTGAGKGTRNLVDYYDEMSHGNLNLSQSQVFDWIDYGHTNQDLSDVWNEAQKQKKKELIDAGTLESDAEEAAKGHAHDVRRAKLKEWARQAAKDNNIDLSGFDLVIHVFNQRVDYFGSYGEVVLNWDSSNNHQAVSVDLTGVAHEVGHGLGLDHSGMAGSSREYGDEWDIMSAYHVHYDISGTQMPPGSSYFTFGPGLNAVNMELMGWLDPTRVLTIDGSNSFSVKLCPLHQRALDGWLAARIQVGSSPSLC